MCFRGGEASGKRGFDYNGGKEKYGIGNEEVGGKLRSVEVGGVEPWGGDWFRKVQSNEPPNYLSRLL